MTSGGFQGFLESPRGTRSILIRAKKAIEPLWHVHGVTDYLCRVKKCGGHEHYIIDPVKFTLEAAKRFVEKKKNANGKTYRRRNITKTWEQNKQAAPYIHALFKIFLFGVRRTKSISDAVVALEKIATNQELLNRLIGRAAYAADILDGNARDVRLKDFKGVKRVNPHLYPFDADERTIIEAIDPNLLSDKDTRDYRPKTKFPSGE
jgi:hypothetical protein